MSFYGLWFARKSGCNDRAGSPDYGLRPLTGYAFNPFPLMRRAASGDAAAMRELAQNASQFGGYEASDAAMVVACTFARLAYFRTGDHADAELLINTLALAEKQFAGSELAEEAAAESLALIGELDASGEEWAGDVLPSLVQDVPRGIVALSKTIATMKTEKAH